MPKHSQVQGDLEVDYGSISDEGDAKSNAGMNGARKDEKSRDGGGGDPEKGVPFFRIPEQNPSSQKTERSKRPALARAGGLRHMDDESLRHHVEWREYSPSEGGIIAWLRWLISGVSEHADLTDDENRSRFSSLARMIRLLREYEERFGMPESGCYEERQGVLKELTQRLYASGAPIWVLGEVMTKTGEGLTGKRGIDYLLFPRRAFINFPPDSNGKGIGSTVMLPMDRGFNMYALDLIEKVAIRIASFASNTQSVSSVEVQLPSEEILRKIAWVEVDSPQSSRLKAESARMDREDMANEILALASNGAGLFFFTRALEKQRHVKGDEEKKNGDVPTGYEDYSDFWDVDKNLMELFSRLAASEAQTSLARASEKQRAFEYSKWSIILFRIGSSAGACAIWFNGSWVDMLVAGVLAVVVAWVGTITSLSRQERIISEVFASLVVGIVAGLIALEWPGDACFGAMALGAVLDILQGFRVVYSVIELMSRHTISGGANFLEAVLFTSLIAYFLKFGQKLASIIMYGDADEAEWTQCTDGISQWWYFLFVPVAAVSWSGLFCPYYDDLLVMGFHGCIAYGVYWAVEKGTANGELSNFIGALAVALSAGIVSRFTGRQALGNTVAGLYVLLPGAYLVKAMMGGATDGFMEKIIMNAVIIGIGAWSGTLLCSPTLLGTTRGLLQKSMKDSMHAPVSKGAMLYF